MTLIQEVVADMARRAAEGDPFTDWTCGSCGRDGEAGVRAHPYEIELRPARGKRPRLVDYGIRLICPCCSFEGCQHHGRRTNAA